MFLAVSCRRRFFFFSQLYTLLTICTTQFQTHLIQNHKTALSNQIPPHLLDPLWQNWTFGCQWFFIHPLGLSVVLGTQKKQAATGGEGWGELLRGSWTIDYCQWRGSRMRKLSKRRKENQEKQQLRAWDDLDCSSTPPPPLSLPQNTLWKYSWGKASKRSSVLCTSSLDGGNKTASTLAKCIVVFCSECFSVPFSFCQFHFSLRTLRRFTVFSLEENINNVAISVYLIHFKDLPTGKLSCFVFGFCFFYPF